MGILAPAALALLALALPIIALYLLKLRRVEMPVSSSFLWMKALHEEFANRPWRRFHRNLLLLLQLLLLALLVLSLARPFVAAPSTVSGSVVMVLDASASMQTRDEAGGLPRFDRARAAALDIVENMREGDLASVILAGPEPALLVSNSKNKDSLRRALASAAPTDGTSEVERAMALAASVASGTSGSTVAFLSDGALGGAALPIISQSVRYVPLGHSGANIGITALSLRDASDGPELFAEVQNSGSETASALLSVYRDGRLLDSRHVELAGRSTGVITFHGLPPDTEMIEARLLANNPENDLLPVDNRAWALRQARANAKVLLVSEGNTFLERALRLSPAVTLFKAGPAAASPENSYGLTVLDGVAPSALPPGNLLLFAPPTSPLARVDGQLLFPEVGRVLSGEPLLKFVNLSTVHIASARRIEAPAWARVLVASQTGDPLLIAGETGGRRVVICAFDLHSSDLPLQIGFPLLISNLLDWLLPGASLDAGKVLRPGEAVNISAGPEADEITVKAPGEKGRTTRLKAAVNVSFLPDGGLGIYTVQRFAAGAAIGEPEYFAVDLLSREESDVTPHSELAVEGSASIGAMGPGAQGDTRPSEFWPWVLLAGLVVLSLEWWLYAGARSVTAIRGNSGLIRRSPASTRPGHGTGRY